VTVTVPVTVPVTVTVPVKINPLARRNGHSFQGGGSGCHFLMVAAGSSLKGNLMEVKNETEILTGFKGSGLQRNARLHVALS
jgi:hypothetical protein